MMSPSVSTHAEHVAGRRGRRRACSGWSGRCPAARKRTEVARPWSSVSSTSTDFRSLAHSGYRGKSSRTARTTSGVAAIVVVSVARSDMGRHRWPDLPGRAEASRRHGAGSVPCRAHHGDQADPPHGRHDAERRAARRARDGRRRWRSGRTTGRGTPAGPPGGRSGQVEEPGQVDDLVAAAAHGPQEADGEADAAARGTARPATTRLRIWMASASRDRGQHGDQQRAPRCRRRRPPAGRGPSMSGRRRLTGSPGPSRRGAELGGEHVVGERLARPGGRPASPMRPAQVGVGEQRAQGVGQLGDRRGVVDHQAGLAVDHGLGRSPAARPRPGARRRPPPPGTRCRTPPARGRASGCGSPWRTRRRRRRGRAGRRRRPGRRSRTGARQLGDQALQPVAVAARCRR